MQEFKVEFFITPPVEATDSEVREWIEFSLGDRASIQMDNPLSGYDLDVCENGNCLTIQ